MAEHATPVSAAARHESLDVLRGVAVLGILMVNVWAFMEIMQAYNYPPAQGPMSQADIAAWRFTNVFFEQKFITIFSALFGAGVVLMVGTEPEASRKIHFSRMRWLLLIGLLHAYLLWYGDILTAYALAGFIIVSFRRMGSGKLIGWGMFWILLWGLLYAAIFASFIALPSERGPEDVGMALSQADREALVGVYQSGFLDSRVSNAFNAIALQLSMVLFFAGRLIGVMFIGMALFKNGFFSAQMSERTYLISALLGLGAGLPALWWSSGYWIAADFALRAMWVPATVNYFASLFVAFGYAAVVMLICRIGALRLVRLPFAAAGRMAFTNYLIQTLVMVFLAVGGIGMGLFGTLSGPEKIRLVLIVWAAQLIVSPLWLAVFRFGPFEWLWRSLTYGKFQPMLKR